eukprot:3014085-Prymnesium_polylepis.1
MVVDEWWRAQGERPGARAHARVRLERGRVGRGACGARSSSCAIDGARIEPPISWRAIFA